MNCLVLFEQCLLLSSFRKCFTFIAPFNFHWGQPTQYIKVHEPTDAFGLKIGFTIYSDTQGHIEKDSLRNKYPLSYFSSTELCPLRLGPSTRTFFSPGMITWSPVSVCGPVSKQSSAQRLVLCLSHCVVRRVGTESSSVNYFFRPQSESLCWKEGQHRRVC